MYVYDSTREGYNRRFHVRYVGGLRACANLVRSTLTNCRSNRTVQKFHTARALAKFQQTNEIRRSLRQGKHLLVMPVSLSLQVTRKRLRPSGKQYLAIFPKLNCTNADIVKNFWGHFKARSKLGVPQDDGL